ELGHEAAAGQRHLLIEVLTRRYYQIRPLQQVRSFSRDGRAYVTADYLEADQPVHVVATDMTGDELVCPGGPLAAVAAEAAASSAAVVDLYVSWGELTPPPEQQIEQLGRALNRSGLATLVARVTLPAINGSSPWPRSAIWPRSATDRGRLPPCPNSNTCWAAAWTPSARRYLPGRPEAGRSGIGWCCMSGRLSTCPSMNWCPWCGPW